MTDRAAILGLECRLVNAWPAFETEVVEGWLVPYAEGYSRRANSASAVAPGARLDPELVAAIADGFVARGLRPVFRLTGAEDPGADAVLSSCGYEQRVPSVTMTAPLSAAAERDPAVRIEAAAKPAWIRNAADAYGGEKANAELLGRIVRRIRRTAGFATLDLDGRDAAWGFAVAERGQVGLYDLVVAPDLRGLGLGRRLVSTLIAWGREQGATRAYLQMSRSNVVGDALYRSLGFAVAYSYTHRVLPEPPLA